MLLENITAVALPGGNVNKLTWKNPQPTDYPGIRIVRRIGTFPVKPDPSFPSEGIVLSESEIYLEINEQGDTVYCLEDKDLRAETVYYYSFYPYSGTPAVYVEDIHNRAAAIATGKYDMAGQMYDLLPRIYHRYDTHLGKSGEVSIEDESKGQLRRFLDLPGYKLDQLRSLAAVMSNFYNLDQVDGRLLPLLAQWIGWKTNYLREIDTQRNEIRNAPFLYQRIGLIPTIEATVKRLIGWESRTKEFVHNVFISNNPERMNLWMKEWNGSAWSDAKDPLSIDWAFEGRPTVVRSSDTDFRLYYHTLRNNCWNIQSKIFYVFSIDSEFEIELNSMLISSNLRESFKENGFSLSEKSKVSKENEKWIIRDFQSYTIKKESGMLNVSTWKPSEPVTQGKGFNKHPVVVPLKETFWVFWDSFNELEKKWSILCCTLADNNWIVYNNLPDNNRECKRPWAIVDNANSLWLFWLEMADNRWQFKYSTYNGNAWGSIKNFPSDGAGNDPRVEADPFILFRSSDKSIWVFWSRRELISTTKQKRWKIFYRKKTRGNRWNNFHGLEKLPKNYDDREPSAFINNDGKIELYWSSNRDGSWSIWSTVYNDKSGKWSAAKKVTEGPYSQRDSLPVLVGNTTFLFYRSNQSITYPRNVYGATETVDFRYAGSTSYNTENLLMKELREQFEDFQTYTYDTGKTYEDWYARDTAGVFLEHTTNDQTLINSNLDTIRNLLEEFLPIQIRPVFFIETPLYKEVVYTKNQPGEYFFDEITESISEQKYNPIGYSREDTVPDWIWMYTVDGDKKKYIDQKTVNFNTLPISTKFRTWHTGFIEEEVLWT